MKRLFLILFPTALLLAGCSQGTAPPPEAAQGETRATTSAASAQAAPSQPERIPAYFKTPPSKADLKPTLPPERFARYPAVEKAYRIAGEIPDVLAQMPCYCHCDRSAGHRGLADCWADDHGAT